MTATQPEQVKEVLREEVNQAIANHDLNRVRVITDQLLGLYENTQDLSVFSLYAMSLMAVDDNEGFDAFTAKIDSLTLSTDSSVLLFFAKYAAIASRFRFQLNSHSKILQKRAGLIVEQIFLFAPDPDDTLLAYLLLALFENQKDGLITTFYQAGPNPITLFYIMNILTANGEISKATECFERLSLLFNRDWEKRKSIKSLDRTMNMMYEQGFISVKNVGVSIPEHTMAGEHECRIAFSMRTLREALEEQIKTSAFSLPHTPPQNSEVLIDKILNERAAVFDELVHR